MKRSAKLCILLIIAITLFPMNSFALTNENYSEDPQINMLEDALSKDIVRQIQSQAPAVEAYNDLIDNFIDADNYNLSLNDKYAGAYIEDDRLIISITKSSYQDVNELEEYFSEYPVNVYADAEYSEKELIEIAENYVLNQSNGRNLSYSIDPTENSITINTPQIDNQNLSDLPITFKGIPNLKPFAAFPLIGGLGISMKKGKDTVTIGIGGTYNGKDAIATCGHYWDTNASVYFGDVKIGNIVKLKFNNLQSGDYGIAEVKSSEVATSNQVLSNSSYISIKGTLKLPKGALAYRYGQRTNLGAVRVTNTSVTVHTDSKYITNLIEAEYVSGSYGQGGDSGGPLYAMNSSNKWCISGLTSGGNEDDETITYYTPIDTVVSAGFKVKTTD